MNFILKIVINMGYQVPEAVHPLVSNGVDVKCVTVQSWLPFTMDYGLCSPRQLEKLSKFEMFCWL
jgi:hypothetical protein